MPKFRLILFLVIILTLVMGCNDQGEAKRAIKIDEQDKRAALVIGNGDYPSSPLKNPVNDARDMAAKLERLGFQVIRKLDADQRTMLRVVDKFYKRLQKARVGLFYYAGHGMQIRGRNYLIPVDAHVTSESDVRFESVDAGRILGKMKDAGNELNLVILDACRDNPFKRSFRTGKQGLAKMEAPRGSLVAYATSPGSVAADGQGDDNGIYTKHLLRHMDKPGWSIEKVLKQTRKDVYTETDKKQLPWDSSSLMGDFYFVAGGSAVIQGPDEDQTGADAQSGKLQIRTEPAGAEISINGRYKGRAPLDLRGVNPDSYRIMAEKDGYESEQKQVRVRAGGTAKLHFYLDEIRRKGRLYVHPTPEDARVRIIGAGPRRGPPYDRPLL